MPRWLIWKRSAFRHPRSCTFRWNGTTRNSSPNSSPRVKRRPEVLECFATTGDADYHLRVVTSDMAAYNRFLDEFMFRIPGIRHVRTNIVLKEIKCDVAVPL